MVWWVTVRAVRWGRGLVGCWRPVRRGMRVFGLRVSLDATGTRQVRDREGAETDDVRGRDGTGTGRGGPGAGLAAGQRRDRKATDVGQCGEAGGAAFGGERGADAAAKSEGGPRVADGDAGGAGGLLQLIEVDDRGAGEGAAAAANDGADHRAVAERGGDGDRLGARGMTQAALGCSRGLPRGRWGGGLIRCRG